MFSTKPHQVARASRSVYNTRMPDDHLIFMMGNYEARIPTDRMYSKNHHWIQAVGDRHRVGFTHYSVRLLQDVYFLEWTIDEHTDVAEKQEIGEIESSKAVSSLHTPAAGSNVTFNAALLDDPSAINADNYGDGWLYEMSTLATFLSPQEYVELLEDGWEDTQRLLKGQIN